MTEFILPFEKIGKADAAIAGGKGASLGEMTTAGIPVPQGFVILSSTFERFLEEADLNQEIDSILHTVNKDEMHTVEHASEKIQQLILAAMMPEDIANEIQNDFKNLDAEFVAVRSSATAEDSSSAAWAGQLDTFLNTTEAELLHNVQRCWASLFTPRAIFYRFEKNLHDTKISVAVVVQKMIQSEVSGIAFSVHPVTEDRNQLIIEAGFGLGEAIVSGQVTPDSYVVEKNPRRIIDINVSTQTRGLYKALAGDNEWRDISEPRASSQVLTEARILELSELILKIENHYGFPCDIEWAFEGGTFYITQSRPITTLQNIESWERSLVEKMKSDNWSRDWAVEISLITVTMSIQFFVKMQEIFGVSEDRYLTLQKKGHGTGYLPIEPYERTGAVLQRLARDEDFVDKWCARFKALSDIVMEMIKTSPEELLKNARKLYELNDEYCAWQAATKNVVNFLAPDMPTTTFEKFKEARLYSETYYEQLDAAIRNITDLIRMSHAEYSTEQLTSMTFDELLTYAQSGGLPSAEDLQKRHEYSGLYFADSTLHVLREEDVRSIEAHWALQMDENNIHGTTAYPGKIQGTVRIRMKSGSGDITDGDILVTGMTHPDFLPLMKKAGAIVTDVGGALCHAAIVSRELKRPCIIGTKFASQILKDGDIVEVDADNGVVKIVERKNV